MDETEFEELRARAKANPSYEEIWRAMHAVYTHQIGGLGGLYDNEKLKIVVAQSTLEKALGRANIKIDVDTCKIVTEVLALVSAMAHNPRFLALGGDDPWGDAVIALATGVAVHAVETGLI